MGRVIDVDVLVKIIDKHTKNQNELDDDITCILEEVPTAYDPEEVEEQLKRYAITMSTQNLPHKYFKAISVKRAIEIVKGGVK